MPKANQLPKDLEELTVRNALDVRHASFHSDMDKLIRGLRNQSGQVGAPTPPRSPPAPSQDDRMRAEGRIFVEAAIAHNANGNWFLPGAGHAEWFKDHEAGPEMVVVPSGSFMMGSQRNEPERESTESPQHRVTIAQPFAVARHAVTCGQFAAFVSGTGYKTEGGAYIWKGGKWEHDPKASWRAPGFVQDDSHPVVCIIRRICIAINVV